VVTAADGFELTSFDLLPEVEEQSFWFLGRNRLIVWALQRHFPHARTFLEVGCGTGFVLKGIQTALPQLELTGSDLFGEGVEAARRRLPDIRLLEVDARELPFTSEFDVVGAFDVLEHVDQDDRALAAMFRAATPGGGIVLTVPQHPWLWSAADDFGKHVRRYTRRELVAKVEASGFSVERVTSFVFLLLPLMAAARVRQRRLTPSYDPLAEFRRTRLFTRPLERLLDLERILISAGLSLPFGGSLLIVGRRP
jgi:ubiquinone/menaquinone biosynthesis C-methylase UbiE